MSKNKPKKRKTSSGTAKKTIAYTSPVAPTTENDGLYKKIFQYSVLGIFIITVLLSFNAGINGDDEFQNDYSKKLVSYYSTLGADTSALYIEKGNMHYYGGFFDLLTGAVNTTLGF